MKIKKKELIAILVLGGFFLSVRAYSQEDAEFRMEIGGGLGTSFYLGDVNNKMYKNQQLAAAAQWRYLFDHHNAIKVQLLAGSIKGKGDPYQDFYPVPDASSLPASTSYIYDFSSFLAGLDCMYELNFWPYGYYSGYMGYKRLTPFLQLGMGLTYSSVAKKALVNIPIGFGVKYRLGKRLNLTLDWAMHFGLSDKLDGVEDPKGTTSEFLKNKDNYCTTMLTLTYNFAPICPNCNKAD